LFVCLFVYLFIFLYTQNSLICFETAQTLPGNKVDFATVS